jgi:hypothetical protein
MVTNYVGPTTSPDITIGYTSTEYYDQHRDLVRALKVRGVNQNLAYWPDSDNDQDRQAQHPRGALHFAGHAPIGGRGGPQQRRADGPKRRRHIIDWFQGNPVQAPTPQLPFDVNEIYAQRGVVPQCAMKVTTNADMPVFSHYSPAQPCQLQLPSL